MVFLAVIIGLVIIGIIALIKNIHFSNKGDMSCGLFFGLLLSIYVVIETYIIVDITQTPKPRAIDVYQGKTTLEYTIIDGIKVDSVVVFKENNYGND